VIVVEVKVVVVVVVEEVLIEVVAVVVVVVMVVVVEGVVAAIVAVVAVVVGLTLGLPLLRLGVSADWAHPGSRILCRSLCGLDVPPDTVVGCKIPQKENSPMF